MGKVIASDELVSTQWVEDHLDDPRVRVIDVDVSRKSYDSGPLPGAVLWNVYADMLDADSRLVDGDARERLVQRSGIGPETTVVCYGYSAAYAFWLLALHGHRRVHIMNASRATWIDEGRPMTTDAPSVAPTAYRLGEPDRGMRASREEVAAAAEQDRVIIDVRSVPEYLGERFWPSGAAQPGGRAGHVPGAVLIPIEQALRDDGSYKDADDLRALYEKAGVLGDRAVVT